MCYSADELERLFEAGSSFVDHLRHEGKILFDPHGILERLLHGPFEPRLTIADELEAELARLKIYDDLTLFNDNFLFPLAQIYAIGKAVVILGLLAEGTREFSRERAFSTFRARHPEVADALEKVAALRPFYRRVTRRRPEPVPFAHKGAGRRVEEAVAAVRRVAAAIE